MTDSSQVMGKEVVLVGLVVILISCCACLCLRRNVVSAFAKVVRGFWFLVGIDILRDSVMLGPFC